MILRNNYFIYHNTIVIIINKTKSDDLFMGFEIINTKLEVSEKSIFWFNPKYGVVAIENSEIILYRKDCKWW